MRKNNNYDDKNYHNNNSSDSSVNYGCGISGSDYDDYVSMTKRI